jgi:DNA repair exonuclease SbcCD ATPase subunit
VLAHAHQALQETEVAIRQEWEALETEHQRLGDWCTQLEKRTKAASCQFASERAELEQEREDFKEDIQKVSDREEEVTRKERSLVKKKEHLDQKEEAVTPLHDKLKAYNTVLEKKRDKQVAGEAKLQQELANKASDIARAEVNLMAREASFAKRVTKPPKSYGPPIVVLVQRTLDNPVGAPESLDKFGICFSYLSQERFTRHADITNIRVTRMRKQLHKLTFILKVRQNYILQTRI